MPAPRRRVLIACEYSGTVRKFQDAERIAKDAFYAQHATEAKPGGKPSAKYIKLQAAMITATKARQAALTEYAVSLGY